MAFERVAKKVVVDIKDDPDAPGVTFEDRIESALNAALGDDFIIRHMERMGNARDKVTFLVVADKTTT